MQPASHLRTLGNQSHDNGGQETMAEPILIGVNLDGVLEHDGLPLPAPAERFLMVAGAGVFDYVEKNPARGENLSPYFAGRSPCAADSRDRRHLVRGP